MQLISPGLPLAAASATSLHPRFYEFFQREEVRHLAVFFAAIVVGSQLFHIVAVWIASQVAAEKRDATFGNAAKVWLFGILAAVGVWGTTAAAIVWLVVNKQNPLHMLAVLGGALLLWLLLVFFIPMKVYDLGVGRAALLMFLAGFINGSVTTVAKAILTPTLHMERDMATLQAAIGQTSDERGRFYFRLIGQQFPDEIDRLLEEGLHPIGPRPSLADQEAMVRTLQQKLTARQQTLPPGDIHAINVYQDQIKRYLRFRNEVLARSKPA